jgi:hypothetical protein
LISILFPAFWLAAAGAAAALDCSLCHRSITALFSQSAHFNASRPASAESILGSFEPGSNVLYSKVPGVSFRMERRADGFVQTGFAGGRSQTERFDLVIGSGRRGQSYLYWRDGLLFQLPVSYHAGSKRWINSPGYEDGKVHFGRVIPPQCLDCHATRFRLEQSGVGVRYATDYSLGIRCSKCHGEAQRHEQIVRPKNLDLCARCHAGLEEERTPEPDVHGNQVGLLKASRCFQKSASMSCATCHDVHRLERDPATLSARCGTCHESKACPTVASSPASNINRMRAGCVECHMPLLPSKLIEVQSYRTHRIAVYKKK